MTLVIADRVLETTTTTGTGSLALLGAAASYQSFSSGVGVGNTTYYCVVDQSGGNWEVGLGTLSGSSTLARTTVLASSNSGSLVNFLAGTKNVFVTLPAEETLLSSGSYSNPSWITAISGTIVTGNITGNAANVTGTVAIGNGGTGATTANTGLNALLPTQTANSGKVLQTNGTNTSWASVAATPGGSNSQLQYNNSGAFGGVAGVTTASGTPLVVTAQIATDVPLTVVGASSQSGDLTDWTDSNGVIRLSAKQTQAGGIGGRFSWLLQSGNYGYIGNDDNSNPNTMTIGTVNDGPYLNATASVMQFGIGFNRGYTLQGRNGADGGSNFFKIVGPNGGGGNSQGWPLLLVGGDGQGTGQPPGPVYIIPGSPGSGGASDNVYLNYDGTNTRGNTVCKGSVTCTQLNFQNANHFIVCSDASNTMNFAPSTGDTQMGLSSAKLTVLPGVIELLPNFSTNDAEVRTPDKGGNTGTGLRLLIHGGTGSSSGSPTAGGDVQVYGGNGGGGNTNGGSIYIYGGAKVGSGTNGNVYLNYDGTTAKGMAFAKNWIQNTPGEATLTSAFTDATGTLANTNISFNVISGQSYRIQGYFIISNTTAADGFQCDFAGGTATASLFDVSIVASAGGTVHGTALSTNLHYSNLTGLPIAVVTGVITASSTGTLILRAATNTHVSGTMTLAAGSYLALSNTVLV